MNVRYQIFISSTYEDLKAERDQVVKTILEMGHIPVGMEMFSAADEDQWKVITRHIDQSDYYIVIVAHRYGSIVDGVSYTEKEYDYAVECGVPVLGFVINDDVSRPPKGIESDNEKRAKLEAFRGKVKSKPVTFWNDANDLGRACSVALQKAMALSPREGWIRAVHATPPSEPPHEEEIIYVDRESADVRSSSEQIGDLEQQEKSLPDPERRLLEDLNTRTVSIESIICTYDEVFTLIAQKLLTPEEFDLWGLQFSVLTEGPWKYTRLAALFSRGNTSIFDPFVMPLKTRSLDRSISYFYKCGLIDFESKKTFFPSPPLYYITASGKRFYQSIKIDT